LPSAFFGERSMSAMRRLAGSFGSIAKYTRPITRSCVPASSRRRTSIRTTSAVEIEANRSRRPQVPSETAIRPACDAHAVSIGESIDRTADHRAVFGLPATCTLFSNASTPNTERAALSALPPEAARRAFFACWARKEAFVKALGLGLSYPLDAFDVSVGAQPELLSGGEGWAIGDAPDIPGYATAIVAGDDTAPLVVMPMVNPQRAAA